MLRQWKYRDYYHPNITLKEQTKQEIHLGKVLPSAKGERLTLHLYHCIEMLRSATMCRVDLSLTTFTWANAERPMLGLKRPPHMCVDWPVFMSSLQNRVITEEESRLLKNPRLDTSA